jgi:hypothetical protein
MMLVSESSKFSKNVVVLVAAVMLMLTLKFNDPVGQVEAAHNIEDFGAVATLEVGQQPDVEVANQNAAAIAKAFEGQLVSS